MCMYKGLVTVFKELKRGQVTSSREGWDECHAYIGGALRGGRNHKPNMGQAHDRDNVILA